MYDDLKNISRDELHSIRVAFAQVKEAIMSDAASLSHELHGITPITADSSASDRERYAQILGILNEKNSTVAKINSVLDEIVRANSRRYEEEDAADAANIGEVPCLFDLRWEE